MRSMLRSPLRKMGPLEMARFYEIVDSCDYDNADVEPYRAEDLLMTSLQLITDIELNGS